jgi:Tfp pilus assembly protein PilZ
MTALDARATGWSDERQLEFAASEGRVLFGFNVAHFSRLHAEYLSQGKSHAGIIVAPQQRYSVGEQIRRLVALMSAKTAEQMQGQIEFLSNWPPSAADQSPRTPDR